MKLSRQCDGQTSTVHARLTQTASTCSSLTSGIPREMRCSISIENGKPWRTWRQRISPSSTPRMYSNRSAIDFFNSKSAEPLGRLGFRADPELQNLHHGRPRIQDECPTTNFRETQNGRSPSCWRTVTRAALGRRKIPGCAWTSGYRFHKMAGSIPISPKSIFTFTLRFLESVIIARAAGFGNPQVHVPITRSRYWRISAPHLQA